MIRLLQSRALPLGYGAIFMVHMCTSTDIMFGAQGGTWTRMVSRTILSRVRLPIPPLGQLIRTKLLYIK